MKVLVELASGKLNPHTLITCEEYAGGPELHLLSNRISDISDGDKEKVSQIDAATAVMENSAQGDDVMTASPLSLDAIGKLVKLPKKTHTQPFTVRVSPDVFFLADLHAHLSDSEIIGFLGGRYVKEERCIYIQAAFPCKATERSDAGRTDVEMDPMSQIVAGDAIAKNGMAVVGWYHSHPTFQPDPSVTDIENQGNYQRLFRNTSLARSQSQKKDSGLNVNKASNMTRSQQGHHELDPDCNGSTKDSTTGNEKIIAEKSEESDGVCPFVGLIIGTYDGEL